MLENAITNMGVKISVFLNPINLLHIAEDDLKVI